jgi:glycosyltransferase involved in cell wall biosynthesis
MRILYAACGLVHRSGSGPTEHVLALARALGRQPGVELTVLFAGAHDPVPEGSFNVEDLGEAGIEQAGERATDALVLGLHPGRYLSHRKKVLAYAKQNAGRFDVLVERMWGFGGFLALHWHRAGKRVILEENGPISGDRTMDPLRRLYLRLSQYRLRRVYRSGRSIIVQTEALAERLKKEFHVSGERLAVVPNGVDLDRFKSIGKREGPLLMVFAGTLDADHDLEPLCRAAAGHTQEIEVRILGSGPGREGLEKIKSPRIRLLGRQAPSEVVRHLGEADLAVAPYSAGAHATHGFQYSPLKLLEYAAAGCAVVAAGPRPESPAFKEGVNGFWIGNEAAQWSRLLRRLPDRAALRAMGAEGKERVKGMGWDRAARRYLEIIREPPVVAPMPFANMENRYIERLHRHLHGKGVKLVDPGNFRLSWLRDQAGAVDVIHLHWPESHYQFPGTAYALLRWLYFMARLITARRLGYHLVWTAHNATAHDERLVLPDRITRRFLLKHAGTIVLGRSTVPALGDPVLSTVIPHGHYIGCYEGSEDLGLPKDKKVYLFAGTLRRYKGVEDLVRRFAAWKQDQVVLVVAGKVKDKEVEEALLPHVDGRRCFYFPGFISDERMGAFLSASDFVVLPYRRVHMSGSLVMALSCARPVIAPDLGLIREYLPHDAGILYAPGELMEALEASLSCDARAMGEKGKAFAATLDWEAIAEAHLQFYGQVIRGQKHVRALQHADR